MGGQRKRIDEPSASNKLRLAATRKPIQKNRLMLIWWARKNYRRSESADDGATERPIKEYAINNVG